MFRLLSTKKNGNRSIDLLKQVLAANAHSPADKTPTSIGTIPATSPRPEMVQFVYYIAHIDRFTIQKMEIDQTRLKHQRPAPIQVGVTGKACAGTMDSAQPQPLKRTI